MASRLSVDETAGYTHKITVVLNGTDHNPYHMHGLTQNPFPQIAEHRYSGACLRVQRLGGDPIPNTDYIREVLKGFSEEFVELCCERFRKGEEVKFDAYFNE